GLDLEKLAKEVSTEMITSEAAVAEAEAELSNKGGTKISGVEDGHHGAGGHRRRSEQHHSDEERGGDEVDDDHAGDAIGEMNDGHAGGDMHEEHADEEISGEHTDDGSLERHRIGAGDLEQLDYRGHEEGNRSDENDEEDHRSDHRDEGHHQGDQHTEEDHESDQRDEEADRSSGMDDDYRGDETDHSHHSEEQEDGEETEGEEDSGKYEYLDGVKKLFKKEGEGKEADSSSFVHKKMKVHAHTARTTAAPGSFIQTGPDGEEEEDDDEDQQEERGEDDGDEERENGDEEIEEKEDKDAHKEEPSRGAAETYYDVEGLDQGIGEGNAAEGKKDLSDVRLTIEGSVPMTPDTIKKSNEQPKENLKEQQDVLLVKYQVLVSRIDGAVNALKAT
ncbi:hypothetical protein FOZ62_005864, partial [Perkinsus olseni]